MACMAALSADTTSCLSQRRSGNSCHLPQAPAYNDFQRQQQAKVNLNQPVAQFKDMVMAWQQRSPGMDIEVKAMHQRDLPPHAFPDGMDLLRVVSYILSFI